MDTYRLVLADDHVIIRQGMKRLIEDMDGLEVVGEASNGIELIEILPESRPDMVILDVSMPKKNGIVTTKEIKRDFPEVKVLIMTMHKSREYLDASLSAGADGYMLKEDSDIELLSAINTIKKGDRYVNGNLAIELAEQLINNQGDEGPALEILSRREVEILTLLAQGRKNGDIAVRLCISKRTVEGHRAKIMKKLNMKKIADLVRYAIQKNLL